MTSNYASFVFEDGVDTPDVSPVSPYIGKIHIPLHGVRKAVMRVNRLTEIVNDCFTHGVNPLARMNVMYQWRKC